MIIFICVNIHQFILKIQPCQRTQQLLPRRGCWLLKYLSRAEFPTWHAAAPRLGERISSTNWIHTPGNQPGDSSSFFSPVTRASVNRSRTVRTLQGIDESVSVQKSLKGHACCRYTYSKQEQMEGVRGKKSEKYLIAKSNTNDKGWLAFIHWRRERQSLVDEQTTGVK